MKLKDQFKFDCLLVVLLVLTRAMPISGRTQNSIQVNEMSAVITNLRSSTRFPDASQAIEAAEKLTAKHGMEGSASMIVEYVQGQMINVDDSYAARLIGDAIQPQFDSAVVQAINVNKDAFGTGRLLALLRSSNVTVIPSLADLLQDKRTAEKLSEDAQADGDIAYRVSDIAFNVINEIQSIDKPSSASINRSFALSVRDKLLATLHDKLVHGSGQTGADVERAVAPHSLLPPNAQMPRRKIAESKQTAPGEQLESIPFTVCVVLALAALGLLWLIFKSKQ